MTKERKEVRLRTAYFDALIGVILIFFGLLFLVLLPSFLIPFLADFNVFLDTTIQFWLLVLSAAMILIGGAMFIISIGKGLTRSF